MTQSNPKDPRFDPVVRKRRNRLVALVLVVIAIAFYVGIGLRWHLT